jgi:iron complex outermembrane receptor protein
MRHLVIIPLLLFLLLPLSSVSQLKGRILAKDSGEPIPGAFIMSSENKTARSDFDGNFELAVNSFPVVVITTKSPYLNDTIEVKENREIIIFLQLSVRTMDAVVVSAGRRNQKLEEVSVSMEILKPSLINNKGITDLEQAVNQSPGVFSMDGQVSIRGGGGYAYGAGSRVLLLWNGVPMVSPDVGDVKWNAIPMENSSQIEIIKGASSVLYGSGALNGVISMTEKEPSRKGELSAKIQAGIYGNPKRESLKWWSKNPTFYSCDVFYGKMHRRIGYTFSMSGYTTDGYRKGEVEDRIRVGGSLVFRPEKLSRLKTGLFYNAQYQYTGNFILWESDTLGYIAQGGMDPMASGSTLSYQKSLRLNVDPYAKFTDRFKNKHELKTRYYLVTTGNLSDLYASSKAEMYYVDYQFQHSLKNGSLILGATSNTGLIKSSVFNNHLSNSAAIYGQIEKKFGNLDLTGGLRVEYFQQDNRIPDSEWRGIPFYPIVRVGAHYKLWSATHLRTSFGQGIRFPSVAERYVATSSGGVVVFPNPDLKPEKGYSAEIGIKQLFKIGDWKSTFDVAAFINDYSNMIEFTFGLYNPASTPPTIDWLGFRAENAEAARITGVEISFNSWGKIKDVEIISLIGYTYMNPISKNTNPEYIYGTTGIGGFSDTSSRMLKYRFNHLAKLDVEANYKGLSCGISMRCNSYMRNIDAVFMQDLDPTVNTMYILPGLKEYREKHKGVSLVFDARIGYKFANNCRLSFIVNNLLNAEYTSRPGDIQPPRTFIVQFAYQLQ